MAEKLPKNVVWDVGNVLLSWNVRTILQDHLPPGHDLDLYRREIFDHRDWIDLDRGTLDEEEAILRFAQRTGAPLDLLHRLVHASKSALTPMPESLALLEELHRRGVGLYVLSNMSHGTWEFLRPRHDFWDRFHGIVISAQVRLVKPDPAIYRHLLDAHSLAAGETLFMDDRPENVAGARSLGIHSFLFEGASHARDRILRGAWANPN
jgi:HAD superfamily hydrolase (TIGR01509 family)